MSPGVRLAGHDGARRDRGRLPWRVSRNCRRRCRMWREARGPGRELERPTRIDEVRVDQLAAGFGPAAVQVEKLAPPVRVTQMPSGESPKGVMGLSLLIPEQRGCRSSGRNPAWYERHQVGQNDG
jgi:hypothetical protein